MRITTFFFLAFITFAKAQTERMEPPFWWTNMRHNQVEILFYGKDIAQYNVHSKHFKIENITRVENVNYLFVTVSTKSMPPGNYTLDFFKNGQKQFSEIYELKQRKAESALRKGFDSSDVIYLIMPDRFANGNPENDTTYDTTEGIDRLYAGGRHGGDIEGIIKNLDYLQDLGITAIWSTPMLEDNEPVYSYHTYAQSDYYKIDPRYGSNEDYKHLSFEMRKRGMKLIKDYVTNHWGSQHWVIRDLPDSDWVHTWEDGGATGFKRSNYRMTTQYDPNASLTDAENCMNGWFDNTMPDMNQKNQQLLNYMIQNAIWWIEYADLGGLRVDTYSYNDKEGIAQWTKAIMDEYPNFNIVGEVWMHNQAAIAYWQKESPVGAIQEYNSHLPSVMDFTLYDAITTMFNESSGWSSGMQKAYDNFTNDYLYANTNNLLVFAGNHDTNRINEIYDSNVNKYKLALTLILTTRGIPQLYYGDEIGMRGNKDLKGDGDIRRDFPGGWPEDTHNAFTKEGRTKTQESYHSFTKKLVQFRKSNKALHFGKLLHYIPQDDVYVYFRILDKERVMIILNNSDESQQFDIDRFDEGLQGAEKGFEIFTEKIISLKKEITIPAKTAMVIDLKT